MLIGLRIISILFDLFLASVLFYGPISKSKHSKETLLVLCCCFLFHVALVFLFLESRVFLVSNLLLSILESSLVGLYFGYSFRDSSFWIFLQTSLTLLAGAVLNQAIQLFLPLSKVSKNLGMISGYLAISFLFSTVITLVLRQLFRTHQKLSMATSRRNWLYQFIVPILSIIFAFTVSAIQGQVFGPDYLSVISLLSLIVLSFSSLYFTLHLSQQQHAYYQNKLDKEQLQFQLRETQQSQEEYQRLQSLRHDLKNKHLTLLALLEENPDEAREYLQSLTDSISGKQTFYSKNPTVNYLLNQKLHDVEDEIELDINCFIPQELSIQPDVLAVILGNCLDNSISACLRLTDKSERTLSLNIRYFQQNLFISINNTFNEQEQETRKTRQRDGWGLRNVDALVQEYQGTIKRFKENGHYRTEILLPSPVN
ncbi:sensor histidine kinase [Streptococcus parasanguinis]|uniref:GHKL domain-containing protein n=1 Tax=Streptococcus parasanguinis TaxID=1318 RepID=A0A6L6LDX7_STRPA|nr:GHKL domain-containing protein [Streptococcus parasanguinis]MBK5058043.1 GHKL domain-containing protein [Streptococcus parasanguinis]MTR63162.1 GHKL domain-containing protein [Streptococcus parasanguinis]MTR63937.1 GHKL domain-containing protein [Streptococcus parasanguinis]MTR68561.1 GHKL domain-containing protein [Streptococcus parasanguinis]MTS05031.1 GHKL domain-containing protein [Streptococcus parasanguinis]